MFDIVKEVVAETIGGLVTRSLGLGTARQGGGDSSLLGTLMRVVGRVASGKSASC